MIEQKELKKILRYNQQTGEFLWLVNRGTNKTKGAIAGWRTVTGYSGIMIKSKLYLTEDIDFNSLIEGGFIDGDIGLLARRKQSAVRETETEAEAEREAETCTKENSREVVQPIREARA